MNFRFFRTGWLFATAAFFPFSVQASYFTASSDKGLIYQSPKGNIKLKAGGRLHLDGAVFNEDKALLENDWIVRRARLSLRADLYKYWRISTQYDFTETEERILSLAARYSGFKKTYITAGQFQETLSLEQTTSSNNFVFMERSLANALIPDINVGFAVQHWGKNWGITAGSFWETYIEDSDLFAREEDRGLSGRFTFAPIRDKNTVLHLGASLSYRLPSEDQRIRIRTQPESEVTEERFVSSGRMRNVDSRSIHGLEAMFAKGSVTLQGEYITTRVSRFDDKQDETFEGGYLAASWLLNGKQRSYSSRSGTFGSVNARKQDIWELGIRRSFLDLNSTTGTITGGQQTNTTFAINWYLNQNVRMMFNYIDVDTDAEAGNDDPTIMQLRLQWVI